MTKLFVTTLDLTLADKLRQDLLSQDFEISIPPHTCFAAKKKGISCTLYLSGKLVVQGKESAQFIEFYLEPEILGTFSFSHPLAEVDLTPRIGIDESGKGDFFGPLCIAGVYANTEQFALLKEIGVKDSKSLSDNRIKKIAIEIKKNCLHHIVRINPLKYNEIYASFKNLNRLLAWGHATAIEQMIEKSQCHEIIVDQFAEESVVLNALKRKNIEIKITQRHRAEEDLTVAAASILARAAFLEGLEKLSETVGMQLPKGSSALTIEIGKAIVEKWGVQMLLNLCKHHFKTLDAIVGKERK
jgi:ribonuclease HIII